MRRMKKIVVVAIIVVCAVTIASLCLNMILFQRGKSAYTQLQEVRLDPMGNSRFAEHIAEPAGSGNLVVLFGDSRAVAWSFPITSNRYRFLNRGINNQTTAQILGRLNDDVLRLKPDIVLLQAGVNDLKTVPVFPERRDQIVADCKANLKGIVDLCSKQGRTVILSTIFPVGTPPLERRLFWSADVARAVEEVNGFLASLQASNVLLLDSYSLLCDDQNLIKSEYSKDLLHLNKKGYEVLNIELSEMLE